MVILDTNIIIDHLRSKEESIFDSIMKKFSIEEIAISVITVQELYQGKSTAIKDKATEITLLLSPITTLSYNYQVAMSAGEIVRDLGIYIDFADAAIAATCIQNDAELATLNSKHFNKIPSLKILNFKLLK